MIIASINLNKRRFFRRFIPVIITLYIVSPCFITGCSSTPSQVEHILESAGDNREVFEIVLAHFKDDKFKYDAACFLISNMLDKHSYTGWQIDSLKAIKPLGRMNDDIIEQWKNFDYTRDCRKIFDIGIIDSQLLIDNIEHACNTWHSTPWHKYYSFDEFCEYVLPYRIDNEPLENWRAIYAARYSPLADSILRHTQDVVEVAAIIADRLRAEGFDNHADVNVPHLGALYLLKHRVGYCRENCDIALYAMRSLGIPVATDFYISSPAYNSTHFWNAVIDTTHRAIPFNYTEGSPTRNRSKMPHARKMGKVYRTMYGLQKRKYPEIKSPDFPKIFIHPLTKDVSNEYFHDNKPVTLTCPNNNRWLYLSIYNGRQYEAIDIAPVIKGVATFPDVEDGIILFPTGYTGNRLLSADFPILTGKDSIHTFIPDTSRTTSAALYRKYPIRNTAKFISNMIGGSILCSGDRNFTTSRVVCEFKDTIKGNHVKIKCKLSDIRYIRYNGPADKPIEVAELHLFNNGDEIFPVKILSSHKLDSIHIRNLKLIGDNVWSSFYMSSIGETLTFDLGTAFDIDSIIFVPRNDDNFVREGQDYELFYHDGANGWQSLGRQVADSDSLIYRNIPENSLLWLHNHSGGKEERCFYINNAKQIFI